MSDMPPGEGKIIQVTRDEPAPNPKFVVSDSPLKASIITIFSLIFFGVSLFGALMRLASAHDLNAIRALLMRDDTIGWLTTVSTLLAPAFWLAWRTVVSWFRKVRDVEIVKSADNDVAMLSSEVAGVPDPAASTRARETTTAGAVRLVDATVLHRGIAPKPIEDSAPVLDLNKHMIAPAPTRTLISKVDVPAGGTISLIDIPDRDATAADTAPRIPGDALDVRPAREPNTPEFMDLHRVWLAASKSGETTMDWRQYLEAAGWTFENRRWQPPVGEK